MGTDCKVHVEIRDECNTWHHYTTWYVPRNYRLFTRMCGVREVEGVELIGPLRDPPGDVTFPTSVDIDRTHAAFLLTGAELEQVIDEEVDRHKDDHRAFEGVWSLHHRGGAGYLFGNGYKLYGDERHGFVEVRAICCFD